MGKFIDLTGMKFHSLTVIRQDEQRKYNQIFWVCQCECGNFTTVSRSYLKNGHTKSCGCLRKKTMRDTAKRNTKHGESRTRLYRIWTCMLTRCTDTKAEKYKYYGGKGVSVCDEWLTYENFREFALNNGYNDSLTIERIDVNGNYNQENCKFVTMKEQANNRTSSLFLTYKNETLTQQQLCDKYNIRQSTFRYRISRGFTVEQAIETPIRQGKYNANKTKRR